MKKLILILTGLTLISIIHAQSVDEIVKKYTAANKLDKVMSLKTIKITGNMAMMGTEMPLTMWMKNPNKVKTVTSFNGQDMIQVFDGVKGYIVNPMMGSTTPKEMSAEEIKETLRTNMFQNYMATYLKNGQLSLNGDDKVNDKPAYKVKATPDGGTIIDFFIDKASYLVVKISSKITQGGMVISLDTFPTDYTETNGLMIPMKTTTSAQGMQLVMNFTKVEIDTPMDDSIFKIN
jgi:zinc protease